MKRGSTSLALPRKFFWMDLAVHMDVQRNPGPPFDEFSCGYASLPTPILNSRNAYSGRINYPRWELFHLKSKYFLSPDVYSTPKCLRIRHDTSNLKYISTIISSDNDSELQSVKRSLLSFHNKNPGKSFLPLLVSLLIVLKQSLST